MARRTKEEAAATRQSLLKAGLAVFGAKGYAAANLADVAAKAGVTRGAIYWHFGNKAELYNALIREFSARGGQVARQAIQEGGTLGEILKRVLVRLLSSVEEDEDLRAVMEIALFKTEHTGELKSGWREQAKAGAALLAGITEVMEKGIASGELRPDLQPIDMARAFLAYQNGAVYIWLQDPKAFSLRGSAPSLAEIFLAGIMKRP